MQGPRFSSHRTSTERTLEVIDSNEPKSPLSAESYEDKAQYSEATSKEQEQKTNRGLTLSARVKRNLRRHGQFVGPGVLAAVAYLDPGNFSTDLASGSQYGYSQLTVVLLAAFMALLFQLLSTRLGVATGVDLASHCRAALHDRPRHKLLIRWGVLYPLYVLSELAIIFTDIAESLGSAIAINLLIPKIPLPVCVVLTGLDVLLILWLFDQYPSKVVTRGMRIFEASVALLVLIVLAVFVALLVKIAPDWKDAFNGFIPSAQVFQGGALYAATGIVGATVMPHAFFIGSKLATVRRLSPREYGEEDEVPLVNSIEDSKTESNSSTATLPSATPSLACVRVHMFHASWDIALSLIGFALVVNSAILMVAAAVFYYGDGASSSELGSVADLFAAYDLIKQYIGPAFAIIFAIALLCSATAASLTVTLAGQILSEGFIHWRTVPWKRRAITRAIGIVPSLVVAIAVGRAGIDTILIASQVALSMVLPFVLAPLIIFTTSQSIMSVPIKPQSSIPFVPILAAAITSDIESSPSPFSLPKANDILPKILAFSRTMNPFRKRRGAIEGTVSFASNTTVIGLSWLLWTVILACNVAAIVALATGAQ